MKINAFIYLPSDEDVFTNSDIFKELGELLDYLKSELDAVIYYTESNFSKFMKKGIEIRNIGFNLSNTDKRIINLLAYKRGSIKHINLDPEFQYFQYRLLEIQYPADEIVAKLTEFRLNNNKEICLFINFKEALPLDRPYLLSFKDALHSTPSNLCTPVVGDLPSLADAMLDITRHYSKKISLKDTKRFLPTGKIYTPSKQQIYQEIKTGYFWYLDRFHSETKITYEVFDKTGKKYIGEHDENGQLVDKKEERTIEQYL